MARLVLGPLLRYVGSTQAMVWVETDASCEVAVLGHTARSFHVEGHHYALVVIADLEPASVTPYEVHLDGEPVWPRDEERPPSAIHTRNHERHARLVFGSCRVGAPQRPPYTLATNEYPEGFEVDALWALSRRVQAGREQWPDCLLLLGDQVYADEVSPETRAFIRSRRDVSQPPGDEIADFEEYTRLYREAWSDPDIRWLLSTVPSTMIFDDHDVHDDWNISDAWVQEMRRTPWWEERIVGAFMAYWLYQHLGNLSPPELAEESLAAELQDDEDGGPRLRRFARMADRESAASRWAFHRDFGSSRLVVVDSRAARVLTDGERHMVDEADGPGSLSTPAGITTTSSSPARCRSSWPRASTTWRPGTKPCAPAPGADSRRARARAAARARPRALAGVSAFLRHDARAHRRAGPG